ncbi:MAG: hypothetical protein AAF591_02230 [Verrucomicrobiota bacterium]
MKLPIITPLLIAATFLTACESTPEQEIEKISEAAAQGTVDTSTIPTPTGASPYQATAIQGGLKITRDGQPVSTIKTALPNVEQWGFVSNGNQVVVKSRANHGPASVELFDSQTGTLQDKILAYAIQNGQPAWAADYAD